MEILRIGKYAIKISLSGKEAKEYKIVDSDKYDDNEIKEAFARLLSNATERTDFTYTGRKIFTEIYPCKDGGCEVFISTTGYDSKQTTREQGKSKIKSSIHTSIYEFNSLKNLLKVCFRLNEIKFKEKSSVYYDFDKEKYYLILENTFSKELKFAFLVEYARIIKGATVLYITEHFKCISKGNAVKQFALLSN